MNNKKTIDVSGALFPAPVVLVTTIDAESNSNIITLAWVGVVCSKPFAVSVSIRPSRYSHSLLSEHGELVVNVPSVDMVEKADICGTVSGRDTNKFTTAALTPMPAAKVKPPLIKECPVNIECRVDKRTVLGAHELFICQVVEVHADESCLDESGRLNFSKIAPLIYLDKDYWSTGEKVGRYGFSRKS